MLFSLVVFFTNGAENIWLPGEKTLQIMGMKLFDRGAWAIHDDTAIGVQDLS